MKIISIVFLNFILFCCFSSFAAAQQPPRQSLYAEIGGAGLSILSLNYDRTIAKNWQARAGIGFGFDFSEDYILSNITDEEVENSTYAISLPLTVSYLIGNDKKFLELGGGLTPFYFSEKNDLTDRQHNFYIFPTMFVGYRRQPLDKGFVFRVNLTATYFDQHIYPGLGLSFGFVLD